MSHDPAENFMDTNTNKTPNHGQPGSLRSGDWFASLDWKEYAEASEPAACDTGRCFLVWVDWRAFNPKLTAMQEGHAVIAKWSGCSWMSQTDEDDSWSGPVKCVTHWARL